MSTHEERRAQLASIVSSVNVSIDGCFELVDNLLKDSETSDSVDRSIVLMEVIEDLRQVNDRLRLMTYRMKAE